jgi:hypothetical protein
MLKCPSPIRVDHYSIMLSADRSGLAYHEAIVHVGFTRGQNIKGHVHSEWLMRSVEAIQFDGKLFNVYYSKII